MSAVVREAITVEQDEVEFVTLAAKERGAQVQRLNVRNIEPVTTVTLVVIGSAALVGMISYLLEQRRGGQVIDLAGPEPKFYRDRGLIYGLVVVKLQDGNIKIEVREPRGLLGQVMDTLRGMVGDLAKTAADVGAKRVQAALGGHATVAKA
jgi:hypothetical protein